MHGNFFMKINVIFAIFTYIRNENEMVYLVNVLF